MSKTVNEVPLSTERRKIHASIFFLLCLIGTLCNAQERTSLTTIILVRHAEKDTMKVDPPLSAKGRARAESLYHILRDTKITAVYATQYLRTQETVLPLCNSLGIRCTIRNANRDSLDSDAHALVDEILTEHRGENILISGHSNTLPLIIKAFGIKTEIIIEDPEYDNLFILTKATTGETSLVRLKF